MQPNIKINVKALSEAGLYRRFAIAFVFMSLVPIVLILFLIYYLNITPLIERELPYFRLTILLVMLLGLASFELIRRSMVGLGQFAKNANEIASGDFHKRVAISEKDEIGLLAQSFNKITAELEAKIKELKVSKELLLRILQKIGTAVSSSRGMDNLLELIIQTLSQGLDAASAIIFLTDGSSSKLTQRVSFNIKKGLEGVTVDAGEGLIGRAMKLKRVEDISRMSNDPAASVEFNKGLANKSILVAPLISKGKVLGVILIGDKKSQPSFNNDDIALITNVTAQTAIAIENFQLNEDAERTYLETITALAMAVEARDPYSRGHLDRVANYVEKLGRQMGLDGETLKVLKYGASLHDVGKIGVRDDVLKKTGPLTPEERKEMRDHVLIGVNIIKPIRSMAMLCELVRHHQEFYDGTGYPDGLKGEEIPLIARILKVCDVYDAMTTDRSYHQAMGKEEAKAELIRKSGIDFDPKVVQGFLKII